MSVEPMKDFGITRKWGSRTTFVMAVALDSKLLSKNLNVGFNRTVHTSARRTSRSRKKVSSGHGRSARGAGARFGSSGAIWPIGARGSDSGLYASPG